AALLSWAALAFVLWWRRDRMSVALAFGLAAFLPASNILVPIASLYALNFLYLPLIGVSLALGYLLDRIPGAEVEDLPAPARTGLVVPWRSAVAAPTLALLAVASFLEASIWRAPVSLFTNWPGRFPFSPPAFSALGVGLIDAGDPAAAIE